MSSGKIIGYYSLACDALRLKEKERFFAFNKENKGIKDFPAIKLARMAFIEKYKRNGLGRHFISVLVGLAWDLHEKGVGCRFITVDAYSGAVEFYKKCGFEKNQADKYVKKANNVSMRLDIFTYGDKES